MRKFMIGLVSFLATALVFAETDPKAMKAIRDIQIGANTGNQIEKGLLGGVTVEKSAPITTGIGVPKVFMATYSVAANLGKLNWPTGTVLGVTIPSGTYIYGGFIDVTTAIMPTGAVWSLGIGRTNLDLFAGEGTVTAGYKALTPVATAATVLKATNNLALKYYITGAAATAGVAKIYLFGL